MKKWNEQDLREAGRLHALYRGYKEREAEMWIEGYVNGYQIGKPDGRLIEVENIILNMSLNGYSREDISKLINISVDFVDSTLKQPLFDEEARKK